MPWRGRLIVLAGIVLVALNLRIAVAAVSPIIGTVQQDIALTETMVGLLGTIPVLAFAVFGAIAPSLGRRVGFEPLLAVAMLVSAAGEIARSLVSTPVPFLIFTMVALSGMGMGNVLLPPLVKRYFPDRIAAVTATYTTVLCVSTTIPPLFAVRIADAGGWRLSLAAWATVGIAAAIPWTIVVISSLRARYQDRRFLWKPGHRPETEPKDAVPAASPATSRAVDSADSPDQAAEPVEPTETAEAAPRPSSKTDTRHRRGGRVWRSPLAWGLAVAFGINSMNSYTAFAWLPRMLQDAGLSESSAGSALALYTILGLPCSILAPIIGARMRNPIAVMLFFQACFLAGYAGLHWAPMDGTMIWVALAGLGPGGFPLMLTLINLRTRTSAGSAALSGFTQGYGYALAALGPLLAGIFYDQWHDWTPILLFLSLSMIPMAIGSWLACRPVLLEDTWGERGSPSPDATGTPSTPSPSTDDGDRE